MPKPEYLKPRKLYPLCFGCGHCDPATGRLVGVRGRKRERRMCTLHGSPMGESSVCCTDGTNIETFYEALRPQSPPEPTGWEDF